MENQPTQPTKEQLIEKEVSRLMKLFVDADPNKLDFIREQVKQLAFFNVSIAELHDKLNKWGTLIQYDNGGGQCGFKANPDVKTLTDYQKLTNSIVNVLLKIIPQSMSRSKLSDFFDCDDKDDPEDTLEMANQRAEEINEVIEKAVQEDQLRRQMYLKT